jgi:hypothetical protein
MGERRECEGCPSGGLLSEECPGTEDCPSLEHDGDAASPEDLAHAVASALFPQFDALPPAWQDAALGRVPPPRTEAESADAERWAEAMREA